MTKHDISREYAENILHWQDDASGMSDKLTALHSSKFSGVWIDNTDDRIKVGVVKGLDEDSSESQMIKNAVDKLPLNKITDYVPHRYSWDELAAATKVLGEKVETNYTKSWQIGIGIVPSDNKIRITIPDDPKLIPAEESKLIGEIKITYEGMIEFGYEQRAAQELDDCSSVGQSCADPLRGGVLIRPYGYPPATSYCSAGFIVQGKLTGIRYVLTAGHCEQSYPGATWFAKRYNFAPNDYTDVTIGSNIQNKLWDGIDAMLIERRLDVNPYWSTKEWVFMRDGQGYNTFGPSRDAQWPVYNYASNNGLEGERVCLSGATTGSSCGLIQEVGLNKIFQHGRNYNHLYGLVKTGLCADGGDSGGSIVRGNYTHSALGILTAGNHPGACANDFYYTGMTSIMNEFGNSIELVPW
jgi:streptogrisin C